MIDRLGGLRVGEHTAARMVLQLAPPTNSVGLLMFLAGGFFLMKLWGSLSLGIVIAGLIAVLGLVLFTLRREVIVDREAGTVVVTQGVFGLGVRSEVPLFHLSAVVVAADDRRIDAPPGRGRYVAFLRRRIGGPIYLDEARRCQAIFEMAEAIAEVAELRFEYDASGRTGI